VVVAGKAALPSRSAVQVIGKEKAVASAAAKAPAAQAAKQ
jgi:membrane fusion protein (multidrug efflux system)